ncbi:hypothetical protein FRB96_003362 [Tulasnella sp. 330]|nr:hypothetical protein FRB96_003362 [Tulasnella sp. 330]
MLPNLRVLHVSELIEEGPSVDQVDSILQVSPAVVKLTLYSFSPEGGDEPPIKQTRPIEPLSLRRVTMSSLSPKLTMQILNTVRTPNCGDITVVVVVVVVVIVIVVETTTDAPNFAIGNNKAMMRACIEGQDWEFDTAASILRLLDTSLDLFVAINVTLHHMYDAAKIFGLPSLRCARALRLRHQHLFRENMPSALINEIGDPKRVDWVLRRRLRLLETLSVETSSLDMKALLRVIRAPLEADVEPPSKLKSLKPARELKKYVSEPESTLGGGVICYFKPRSDLEYAMFGESESSSESNSNFKMHSRFGRDGGKLDLNIGMSDSFGGGDQGESENDRRRMRNLRRLDEEEECSDKDTPHPPKLFEITHKDPTDEQVADFCRRTDRTREVTSDAKFAEPKQSFLEVHKPWKNPRDGLYKQMLRVWEEEARPLGTFGGEGDAN